VISASNGAEAISNIDTPGCFDAVITDYAMPHPMASTSSRMRSVWTR